MALEYQKGVNRAQINMELKCYFGPNVCTAQMYIWLKMYLRSRSSYRSIVLGTSILKQELLRLKCLWGSNVYKYDSNVFKCISKVQGGLSTGAQKGATKEPSGCHYGSIFGPSIFHTMQAQIKEKLHYLFTGCDIGSDGWGSIRFGGGLVVW